MYLWSSWLGPDPDLIFHVLGSAPAPAGPSKSSHQTRAKPGISGAMVAESANSISFREIIYSMRRNREYFSVWKIRISVYFFPGG